MSSYAELTLVTDDEQARELASHRNHSIAVSVLRNGVRQLESQIRENREQIVSLEHDQELLIARRDAYEHAAHTLDPGVSTY